MADTGNQRNITLKKFDGETIVTLTTPKYLTLKIGLSVTVLVVGVLVFLKIWEIYLFETRDIIAIFTSGIVCTTLIYHAFNLTLNYEVNRIKIEFDDGKIKFDRKVQALNIISEWHKPEMTFYTIIARDFLNEKSNVDKMSELIDTEPHKDIRKAIVTILNYFEKIAIACEHKIADETVLKEYFLGLFRFYFLNTQTFIEQRRRSRNDNKIFEKAEGLNKKWQALQSKSEGE